MRKKTGRVVVIDGKLCIGCEQCVAACPDDALRMVNGIAVVDSEKCTGCRLCIRDCPSQAITITKVGEKKFEASIDLGRCVYCAQCAETCPRKVIDISTDFELAQIERGKLKIVFHAEAATASCPEESAGT